MALNDSAVLVPGKGHILTGTVGSATQPTLTALTTFANNTATLPTGWTDLGHTDIDEILTFEQEGGETEVKRSWQNTALRETVTETAVDYFVAKSLQLIDNTILSYYYGGGDATVADEFSLPDSATATEKAVTVVFIDGSTVVGFYCPKVSIRREAGIELAFDDFTKVPLRFTVLQASGAKRGKWLHASLGA
jgi:hypothetical protein